MVIFFLFRAISLTRSCSTILTHLMLVGLIIMIISSFESFFHLLQFQNIGWLNNAKNIIFRLPRAITLTRSHPMQTFVGFIIRIILAIERIWLDLTVLEIYEKNLWLWQTTLFYFSNSGHVCRRIKSPPKIYAEYPKGIFILS